MRWRILSKIKTKKVADRRDEIIKALFKNRGLKTKKQQEEFLQPKNPYQLTPKEVGLSSAQIKKAIKRIKEAIKKEEKIIVYGDYDTDGVCATAILWETLEKLGAKAMPFIPKREEGYGLKVDRIDQMVEEGVKLIITVDQGIVHSRQVAHAKKAGVDVIVTDHHVLGKKKPRALAIVHTTKLAGSGVAWFLAKELGKRLDHPGGGANLDLATIGTVTDMVPLLGLNRSIVKFGLEDLKKTKRPGLLALYDFANLDKEKISAYSIGFIIGPRLNAAGRMEDPMESLRLVCTRDENRAIGLAQKLDQKNRERQTLMNQTTVHARKLWLKENGQSALIFVYHKTYQHGVIGLAAHRLAEEFYRPTIILAPRQNHWVASARSIDEFNIVEAIRVCADVIGDHGGHARAAGFSVEPDKLETVKEKLVGLAEERLNKKKLSPRLKIDAELELGDLDLKFYQELEKFAPFGQSNPQPVFATRKVKVAEARTVGSDKQHLKLRVTSPQTRTSSVGGRYESGVTIDAIAFGMGHYYPQLSPEKPIDIVYNLLLDEWNDRKRLQLKLKDVKF